LEWPGISDSITNTAGLVPEAQRRKDDCCPGWRISFCSSAGCIRGGRNKEEEEEEGKGEDEEEEEDL
jgi:hypothetical protein